MADEPPPPVEIRGGSPRPRSRCRRRADVTSISLFFHEPDDEVLSGFPGRAADLPEVHRLGVPRFLPRRRSQVAAMFLGEGIPCFHMLLDLRVQNRDGDVGTIRPYFHAAAPLYRRMMQTGVIGGEVYEGESDGQFMGKSGSQMYETQSTQSKTLSASGGASSASAASPSAAPRAARRRTSRATAQSSQVARHHHARGLSGAARARQPYDEGGEPAHAAEHEERRHAIPELLALAAAAAAAVDRSVRPEPLVQPAAGAPLDGDRRDSGVHRGPGRAARRGLLRERAAPPGVPARQPARAVHA